MEEDSKYGNANLDPLFSSARTGGTDSWETPDWLYRKICETANDGILFKLDPCADDVNHKCELYYTEKDDGLKQPWAAYGQVFVNPPYSDIKKWVKKTYEESLCLDSMGENITLLIPARTDTTWWHDYVTKAAKITFLRGRVKFGDSKNSAPFPSCVVTFRAEDYSTPLIVRFDDWREKK